MRNIVIAAVDTWGTHGYAYLTIRNLTKRTGLSHGIVHYYFSSRDELIHECVEYASNAITLDPERRMEAARDVDDLVNSFVQTMSASLRKHEILHRLRIDLLTQAMFNEDLVDHADTIRLAWANGFERFHRLAHSMCIPAHPDTFVDAIVQDIFSEAVRELAMGDDDAVERLEKWLRAYLKRTLGRGPVPAR